MGIRVNWNGSTVRKEKEKKKEKKTAFSFVLKMAAGIGAVPEVLRKLILELGVKSKSKCESHESYLRLYC